jgi:G6PDH family F420-dependent oxidoreductase
MAQATATLLEMFPGRFWLAVGSGEALNEKMTGAAWPEKPVRNARLKESVEIMRALWRGETVTHQGLVRVDEAKLYTRPNAMPLVLGAAITEPTAEWFGGWADGLLTAGSSHKSLRKLIDAFRRGGGEGKPLYLQSGISYARTDSEALAAAHHQWRHAALDPAQLADLPTPRAFDDATDKIQPDQLREKLRISADLKQHAEWLQQDFDLGFSAVFLLNVSRDMERFIDEFGAHVLPAVAR